MAVGFSTVLALLFALHSIFIYQPHSEEQAMNTRAHANQDYIRFELASGAVTVDANTLEKMKRAMLSFCNKSETEFPARYLELRDSIREELKSSAVWISKDSAGIGLWRLENHSGHLTLVRYPPPSKAPMYIFHATLEPKNSEWEVISFEQEREFGPG